MNLSRVKGLVLGVVMLPLLASCNEPSNDLSTPGGSESYGVEQFTVYKQASCGCCKAWISHLQDAGLESTAQDTGNMTAIKAQYQIAPQYHSCHTAVSAQGYVFEGHVPARHIQAFLANPPTDAIGLAVPGMPLGSPGMEVGDKFTPYEILMLKNDGSSDVFATIENATQQELQGSIP